MTIVEMAAATKLSTVQGRPPLGPRHSDRFGDFYVCLANRLENLEQSLQSKWLSLEWVALGVEFMRSTYSDVNQLLEGFKDVSAGVDDWLEEYMVESMKLLDVCNVLKPAVSLFEQYQMCVQLVVQASRRCTEAGFGDSTAYMILRAALQNCEEELMVRGAPVPPKLLKADLNQKPSERLARSSGMMNSMARHASLAISEKFTHEKVGLFSVRSTGHVKKLVGLTGVMRATRETTDFVARVLIWALNSSSSHLLSTTITNENLRRDPEVWSPSFRRLQQKLNEEIGEIGREHDEQPKKNQMFAFRELKLVETCASELKHQIARLVEIRSSASKFEDEELPIRCIHDTVQQLREHLSELQGGVERVSRQLTGLFDELVRSRKKLMDASQHPCGIHRAHTW